MSTPEQLADLYSKYVKRKSEIKEIKRSLNEELKSYEDQLERLNLEMGQGDLFTTEEMVVGDR